MPTGCSGASARAWPTLMPQQHSGWRRRCLNALQVSWQGQGFVADLSRDQELLVDVEPAPSSEIKCSAATLCCMPASCSCGV